MTATAHPAHAGTGTILFADIVGSTELYERLGDAEALAAVTAVLGQLQEIAGRCQGRVVKTLGDEVMVSFGDPVAAFTAASAMLEAAIQGQLAAVQPVRIRLGFHHGALLRGANGDWFGDTVNTAARLVKLSRPNQALCSAEVVASLPSHQQAAARCIGRFALKGKQSERELFEVLLPADPHPTALNPPLPDAAPCRALLLDYGASRFRIDRNRPALRIGRAAGNDLVCEHALVSRHHFRIELRRDRFVLVDESTNGTWVRMRDQDEIRLLREELPLLGSGLIALGRPSGQGDPAHCFRFAIEAGAAAAPAD